MDQTHGWVHVEHDMTDLANEQRSLLDIIDKIQFAQLKGVRQPRIAVVGDQNAGKSSVLEAVTGIAFPRHAEACTRFATEIRLRYSKEESFKYDVLPDPSSSLDEQTRVRKFIDDLTPDLSFEEVMKLAEITIAPRNIRGRFSSKHVFVVERAGPKVPLLTVVDLPGLVRVPNVEQDADDLKAIEELTDKYMGSSRTIILAIVCGNSPYEQQIVLQKTRHYDPTGNRTIGVLTKPDLARGIGQEDRFLNLVTNQEPEYQFRLGWFVLRNAGPEELSWKSTQRQKREQEFFAEAKWNRIPPSMRGASALQKKLSLQLVRHIIRYLPKLRKEIHQKLRECTTELNQLGNGKDTPEEMREELILEAAPSKELVYLASIGRYINPPGMKFFISLRDSPLQGDPPPQHLRARIVKANENFANRVRERGNRERLLYDSHSSRSTKAVADYAKMVIGPFIDDNTGTEFTNDLKPELVYKVFHSFSDDWEIFAEEHAVSIRNICNEFIAEIIDNRWAKYKQERLRIHYLDEQMKRIVGLGNEEIKNIENDRAFEIKSYDPEYLKRLDEWRQTRRKTQAEADEKTVPYTREEEFLEKCLIHYDLTATTFISNIITQVVERHLIQGLNMLFHTIRFHKMPDRQVEDIAAENLETRERRLFLRQRYKAIEDSLDAIANVQMRKELRPYAADGDISSSDQSNDENLTGHGQRHRPPIPPPNYTKSGSAASPVNSGTRGQDFTSRRPVPVHVSRNSTSTANESAFPSSSSSSFKMTPSPYQSTSNHDSNDKTPSPPIPRYHPPATPSHPQDSYDHTSGRHNVNESETATLGARGASEYINSRHSTQHSNSNLLDSRDVDESPRRRRHILGIGRNNNS